MGSALLTVRALLSLPHDYSFGMFGFGDPGGDLTVYERFARGILPYRDFGYEYGLLPLPVGHLWFTSFGRSPATYLAAIFVCNALILWAFARFARALEIGIVGQIWLLVTLLAFVPSNYLTLSHALEAALITHALAELARGRRSRALALATAALFTRPCLAYFLGLALLLLLIVDARRAAGRAGGRWSVVLGRALLPAFATGVALLALLSARFGPAVALESLLPLTGMRVYDQMGYTPSRLLRAMLFPDVENLVNYYLGTRTATLVLGTLLLTIGALRSALSRVRRSSLESRRAECLLTCAALNLTYYGVMIGPLQSYMYLIGLGVTVMETTGLTVRRLIMAVLIPVSCLGYYSDARDLGREWSHKQSDQRLGGLFCSEEMAADWFRARGLARGETAALLPRISGYDRLFEGFARPTSYFLDRGLATESEIRREVVLLEQSPYVVRPTQGVNEPLLEIFPEFAAALAHMRVVWRGPYFMVYRRTEPAGESGHH